MAAVCASKFYQLPESLWNRIAPLLPHYKTSCQGGRPRLDLKRVVMGILYVLRTGCQWKAMPAEFGSGSAIHTYFQEWVQRGVFHKLWRAALEEYDDLKGIDRQWQSLDGAMTKAPLGGEKNREESHGSRQTGSETFDADRRPGRPDCGGDCRRECA